MGKDFEMLAALRGWLPLSCITLECARMKRDSGNRDRWLRRQVRLMRVLEMIKSQSCKLYTTMHNPNDHVYIRLSCSGRMLMKAYTRPILIPNFAFETLIVKMKTRRHSSLGMKYRQEKIQIQTRLRSIFSLPNSQATATPSNLFWTLSQLERHRIARIGKCHASLWTAVRSWLTKTAFLSSTRNI